MQKSDVYHEDTKNTKKDFRSEEKTLRREHNSRCYQTSEIIIVTFKIHFGNKLDRMSFIALLRALRVFVVKFFDLVSA